MSGQSCEPSVWSGVWRGVFGLVTKERQGLWGNEGSLSWEDLEGSGQAEGPAGGREGGLGPCWAQVRGNREGRRDWSSEPWEYILRASPMEGHVLICVVRFVAPGCSSE